MRRVVGCKGPGTCHGDVDWCERCGDVSRSCDAMACEHHVCARCRRGCDELIGGLCPNGLCYDCDERDRVAIEASATFDVWSTYAEPGVE